MMFPVEIWEKIIKNIDASNLTRLRTVNSIWDAIITKYLKESDAWYKQCQRDIPEKYWLILLENSFYLANLYKYGNFNYEAEKLNYKLWMTMYKAWIKWQNIENYNVINVNKFKPMPDHRPSEIITCCCSLGELLVVGTSEGYIRVYNLRTNNRVFMVDQYEQVQDVKLCIQGKDEKIMLIATSIYNKSKFWNVSCTKYLSYSSGDVICSGYGYYCTTILSDKINVYNGLSEDCHPTRVFIQDFMKKPTTNYSSRTTSVKYVNMIINRQQLCCLSDNGIFCELDLQEINQVNRYLHTPHVTRIGVPKNQKVRRYYLFNPYVACCVTERGYLGISVHKEKWKLYNTFPFLQGSVTAILFHVRVLVLGLDSGDLWLFFVENEYALKTINFKSEKSKKISISPEPIVSVNIMEISGDQRLVVATKSTVNHIKIDCIALQDT